MSILLSDRLAAGKIHILAKKKRGRHPLDACPSLFATRLFYIHQQL